MKPGTCYHCKESIAESGTHLAAIALAVHRQGSPLEEKPPATLPTTGKEIALWIKPAGFRQNPENEWAFQRCDTCGGIFLRKAGQKTAICGGCLPDDATKARVRKYDQAVKEQGFPFP